MTENCFIMTSREKEQLDKLKDALAPWPVNLEQEQDGTYKLIVSDSDFYTVKGYTVQNCLDEASIFSDLFNRLLNYYKVDRKYGSKEIN